MASKAPIAFTRSCWTCKKFRDAWGGKLDRKRNLWHCAECSKPKEDMSEWKKGKPPAIGWYPTKVPPYDNWSNAHRWWDGKLWSWAAFPHEDAERAGRWAAKKENNYVSSTMLWKEMK